MPNTGTIDGAALQPTQLQPENTPGLIRAKSPTIEEQLANVIGAAREVAVIAEELLREFVTLEATAADKPSVPHAIILAPRLLSATQQQLSSLLAMMKTV
jgi:hypothetical protein